MSNLTNDLLTSAVAFHKQGNLDRAEALYLELLQADPQHADALQYLGMLNAMRGQPERAIKYYQQALAISPQHFTALSNLGKTHLDLQQFEAALTQFDLALKVKPDTAQIWHNRGNALFGVQRYADACESYQRALEINPEFAEASRQLPNLLLLCGNPVAALAAADHAIRLTPNAAELHYARGVALRLLGRFEEALISLNQALSLKPDMADALHDKGWALNGLHRYEEALAVLGRALALNDKLPNAHNLRAFALMKMERAQEALSAFDREIALNPAHAAALGNKGSLLEIMGRGQEARAALAEARRVEPDNLEHQLKHAVSWIPTVRDAGEQTDVSRARLTVELQALLDRVGAGPVNNPANVIGAGSPFYLAYQECDNKEPLSLYGELCRRLMQQWAALRPQPLSSSTATLPPKTGKRRVGIVSAHIYDHSVWRAIVRGWVCGLDRQRFEVCVYHLGHHRDAETGLAERRAHAFVAGERDLEDWVQCLQDARLDVLLYPELGMDAMTARLASLRLAPVQIASWGHPESTGLPLIDYYLSAELFESSNSDARYSEQLVRLPHLGCCFDAAPVQIEPVDLQSLGVRQDAVLFICAGTPYKYVPGHDDALVRIAQQVDNAQFLFFSSDITASLTERVVKRIGNAFEARGLDPKKHLAVCGWQRKARFYSVLSQAHVFLDTIGFSGFNTVMQAVDCALPIVTQRGKFMRGRLGSGIMERMGMDDAVCADDDDYVALAVKFALDDQAREQARSRIAERRHVLYGDHEPMRAMEAFLAGL
ncbi:MAG: tetratricopeptide repeat protein [Burkholderiales bacterium]